MPIWPSTSFSASRSQSWSASEKSVEFFRSGELSLVSTRVKPHGANCWVACESYAKRAPGSLLRSLVPSSANVALRPKPAILSSRAGVIEWRTLTVPSVCDPFEDLRMIFLSPPSAGARYKNRAPADAR
jgi:hypothetical protein